MSAMDNSRKTATTGSFLYAFEKLKVKKTQAPKKLNIFSAQKLKLPEVFRPFFSKLKVQSPKNSRKFSVFALKRLKNTIYWYRKANFAPKLRILPKFCAKLKDFDKKSTIFSKNLKTQAIFSEKLNKISPKTQGTGGFYHSHPLENRTKKAC